MAIVGSSSQSSISDDYLHLAADATRNQHSSEGTLRTAISRAYYAVFLTVRDQLFGPDGARLKSETEKKLRKKFWQKHKRNPGSHDLVIFAIADIKPTTTLRPQVFSQQVSQLKEARVHADYHFTLDNLKDIPKDNWREYAEESVELASQLLPVARRLPPH